MAKKIFPGITIYPANASLGIPVGTKPRVTIPHIIGTGDLNGIPIGWKAVPQMAGDAGIPTGSGNLDQGSGVMKMWRFREAVDIAGNNVPGTPNIACNITDITNMKAFPPLDFSTIQFAPITSLSSSKFYELEIEEELEYTLVSTGINDGGEVILS